MVTAEFFFAEGGRPAWHADAACAELPTDEFFPSGSTGKAFDQITLAKAICATCPVAVQCLDYALDTGQDGVWGGMTEDERRAERRRRQRRKGRS